MVNKILNNQELFPVLLDIGVEAYALRELSPYYAMFYLLGFFIENENSYGYRTNPTNECNIFDISHVMEAACWIHEHKGSSLMDNRRSSEP